MESYKLNTICNFLQHKFVHHNAQEDAVACGKILLSALNEKGVSTIYELAHSIGMRLGKLYDRGYTPCSIGNGKQKFFTTDIKAQMDHFELDHDLYGRKVVFTGTLLSI